MGRFGHKVIGKRAAQQAEVQRRNPGRRFGSRVIGDVLQRKAEIKAEETGTRDAAAIVRKRAEAQASAAEQQEKARSGEVTEVVEAPVTANLNELGGALEANPTFYEKLYASEKARAEGPRKGALRLFLAHELDGLDRTDRVEEIQTLLKG